MRAESIEATREQLQYLLHEMQVYEQELKIQNQELRNVQLALEKSRDRYAKLFDFSPLGYVILDERGVIKEINLTAANMLKCPREGLVGFPLIRFVAAEDRPVFLIHLRRCKEHEGSRIITELRLLGKGGAALPVELYSVPEENPSGSLRYRTALTDISERKQAEAEVRRAQCELERRVAERTAKLSEANAALRAEIEERGRLEQELRRRMRELAEADRHKDEFLAMLAHELRNPLAPLRNAEHLMRRGSLTEAQSVLIRDLIGRQVTQLTRLVDDLLDVSRITLHKVELRLQEVEVASVVAQAVETVQPLIEARQQRLTATVPPQSVLMTGDYARLVQVIENLLTKARFKFG